MKKKILALLLAVLMVISLTACGEKTEKVDNTSNNNAASKQGVYKVSTLNMDLGIEGVTEYNINQTKVIDDTIYMIVNAYMNNGYMLLYVTTDLEGNIQTKHTLVERIWQNNDGIAVPLVEEKVALAVAAGDVSVITSEVTTENPAEEDAIEEYNDIYSYNILDDGKLAYIEINETYNNKTHESSSISYLVICDKDGQQSLRTNLTESVPEDGYFWGNLIVPSAEETFFVMSYDLILEVDMNGTVVGQIKPSDVTADMYQVLFYKDGYPVVTVWNQDWTKQSFCSVDIRKGEIVEELDFPDNLTNYNICDGGNSGFDLILTNQTGVYGYNVGDAEVTLVMDYVNSDLATYSVRNVIFVDSERFIGTYNDLVEYNSHVAVFTHVPPENVPDRDTLILATYGSDTNRTQAVIAFNQSNEKYRITIKDYSQYATNEEWYAGITQLNNDIISGKIPDIISCSDQLPIVNYVNKGLLVDFYELMESDESIDRADYCENVFKAYEVGGKLYELPTSFYIWTVYGKQSIFGDKTSLTWDELDAYLAQYEGSSVFSEMTKADVLSNSLRFSYSQLVDEETGECHFNSDMFKSILEFANTYPESINWEELSMDQDYWSLYETQYIENRTLLSQSTIYTVYEAWLNGYYNFAEPTTPVGYPNDHGIGSAVKAINSYAISAKSPYKDGAWEFVKSFISAENQLKDERYDYWGLPILKEALEDSAKYIMEKPYYIDQDGNKVEQDYTIWIKNEEVVIEPADEQEKQRWIDFILSVETKGSDDYQDALEIISEEAAAYFSGQKTVEAVMEIIQSRMNIFISENR